MTGPLLELDDVSVRLRIDDGMRPVIEDVSLAIGQGEMVGLVGESGSGKSMTARTIARLLPDGAVASGTVRFEGADLLAAGRAELRRVRTSGIAVVFQDPHAHVNPIRRVGDYVCEAMRINLGRSAEAARRRALELLDQVGIPDPEDALRRYPFELSGGMLQRVMIAAALSCEPRLLLADEPTTALDVTIQAEILAILQDLRRTTGLAVLFITHDLELAAVTCDRICVMYAGRIVEEQDASAVFSAPLHPYTAALIGARPTLAGSRTALRAIPGRPISAFEAPGGCAFHPRCAHAQAACADTTPPLQARPEGRRVACLRAAELAATLEREAATW